MTRRIQNHRALQAEGVLQSSEVLECHFSHINVMFQDETGNTEFYFISVQSLKQELFGILNINSTFKITISWDKWGLAGLKADSKPRMKFSQLQDRFCPLPQQPCVAQVPSKALDTNSAADSGINVY